MSWETWRAFAGEIDGEFVEGDSWLRRLLGGKSERVVARLKQWTISFDTYVVTGEYDSTTYTRIRAPYRTIDGFRFGVYRESAATKLGKLLGMQDIQVGHPEFDPHFIIKANDEYTVRELLASSSLRQLIQSQPSMHLLAREGKGWFRRRLPQGVNELYFEEASFINDRARLKSLWELFGETLNRLCEIGSASQEDPGVGL